MIRLRATLILILFASAIPCLVRAQEQSTIEIESLNPDTSPARIGWTGHKMYGIGGVIVKYKGAVLQANSVTVDEETQEAVAEGQVRFQRDDMTWTGEHLEYSFKTGQILSQHFRTGRTPFFAEGQGLHADLTNHIHGATNGVFLASKAMITSDDIADPNIKIRARKLRIIPNVRIEAWDAVLYAGDVPIFYFPYYSRNLGEHANNFNFIPGYRTSYGPFVLGSYTWYLNQQLDGVFHLDYREARGIGVGPDLNYHLGRWGEGTFRYYYTHDNDPETNSVIVPPVRQDRQRVYFSYQANPFTNLNIKSLVRWQNDDGVIHDFFPGEYRQNPQPDTFVEVNKFWQNFSLDVITQPRLNEFYETVVRLPEVRLNGFRQQLGNTPVYYESDSSAGYYRRLFAETNGVVAQPDFEAARADTYQQLLLPETFFGWLNVTPRVGGRFTYYSQSTGPGGTNDEAYRSILYSGAEVSFKASRLWPAAQSRWLDVDGVRHIIQPSVNYVYVPDPSVEPAELPQFDYQLASLRQLPIEFPEYNSIDSIESQDTLRFGLRNKVQTKRAGQIEDLLNWDMSLDWHLKPNQYQRTFGDWYSDLTFRPRSWLSLQSQMRFNVSGGNLRMSLHTLTIQPNNRWSWTLSQFYLREDLRPIPTAVGEGNNLINSAFFFRLDENWGFRASQHYDIRSGRMQEQLYTIYRDLRSWTVALTGGILDNGSGPTDYTVAFTFSFKAMPRYGLGQDTVRSHSLLGD